MAFAQTAKEAGLEARVAQLEAQIQTLLQGQQQQQESITQAQARLDQVQVAQPAAKPLQSKPILANPDAVFTYGGFIQFDALVTDTSDGPLAEDRKSGVSGKNGSVSVDLCDSRNIK